MQGHTQKKDPYSRFVKNESVKGKGNLTYHNATEIAYSILLMHIHLLYTF